MPTITSVSVSNAPETFKGSDVKVEMSGIFNESMKVYAVSEDGNSKIECHDVVVGDVTDGFRSASASITMPEMMILKIQRIIHWYLMLTDLKMYRMFR